MAVAAFCGVLFNAWYCLSFAVATVAWDALFGHWVCVMIDSVAVQAVL